MKLLVLGGTAWLGRAIVEAALAGAHEVTCLARARSGPAASGVTFVSADRDTPDAYTAIAGQHWDAVIDLARQPGHVRQATAALSARADRYVFISSVSVYADQATPGQDEQAPRLEALARDAMAGAEDYGAAKVACEDHVLAAFGPARALVLRPGLIAGPGDPSDRTGYWPWRFAHPAANDGRVLVPDAPELPTQMIDVRDFAGWIATSVERRLSGVFDAVGSRCSLPDHLALARAVAGHTGPVIPRSPDWLTTRGVAHWSGPNSLPLWLALPKFAGFMARPATAARAEGLKLRPLEATLADTLAWELAQPAGRTRQAGLPDTFELGLLDEIRGPA